MFDLKTILLIIGLYYILSPIYENYGSDWSDRGHLNYIQSGIGAGWWRRWPPRKPERPSPGSGWALGLFKNFVNM